MPKKYTLEFSNVWFDINGEGERVYDESIPWDGRAYSYPLNNAIVFIRDEVQEELCPMIWWPNEKLPGHYVRGTYLKTFEEFLVYTAAHELRHLEQWHNPRMKLLGSDLEGSDIETDADMYAIGKLFEWRRYKGYLK
jgi:hypothetical protein